MRRNFKLYFLLSAAVALSAGAIWNDYYIQKEGFSKEVVCKNGYLMSIISKSDGNTTQVIEQQYCYDINSWDSDCNHPPVRCIQSKPIKVRQLDSNKSKKKDHRK
jgi:hypothetical protein